MQQDQAFNLLKMGKNVFLTGEAGAGKTYLLNKYIHYLKENQVTVAVTASTGIAATHLQGKTIHAWSGIGTRERLTEKDLEKLRDNPRIKRNYKNAKVLIIDEISMLHKHQLDMVDVIARHMLDSEKIFGGIQVVVCGDFFQLPPVSAASLREEKQFAFEANSWKNGEFHVCYLHEQHRQINDPLHAVLNDIRKGRAGEHTKVPLRTRYKKEPDGATKATKLYSRNINVDFINENELAKLPGQEKFFDMISVGPSIFVDGLKKNCLALENLKLKIGAEVMFIKNDMAGSYVNGTRSTVIGFDKKEGWPIVKTYDQTTLVVGPEEWKYEDNGIVRATITQIPLRLAWAITIHKSQGMTLDAAEIDLSDAFEAGMGYVALSRVRCLSGLKLMGLNEMALKVNPKILNHDQLFQEHSTAVMNDLQALTEEEIANCQQETLIKRFKGGIASEKNKTKPIKKQVIPTHLVTFELLKEGLSIELIAVRRDITVGTVLTHLEKCKSLKKIDYSDIAHLKNQLSKEDFELILNELKQSKDGILKSIYDQFDGKYSYDDLKIVRLFLS